MAKQGPLLQGKAPATHRHQRVHSGEKTYLCDQCSSTPRARHGSLKVAKRSMWTLGVTLRSFDHRQAFMARQGPLWQGKAPANVYTREYILENNHIHVINVVRFVPNQALKIQFKSKLLMFGSFRKLKISAFLWFHQYFYTLHNDL